MPKWAAILVLVLVAGARQLPAQDTLPPWEGGRIRSLGLPAIWKPYLGFSVGVTDHETSQLTTQARFGIYKDLLSPVTEILGLDLAGYVGMRDVAFDPGLRASLVSNVFGVGIGADVRPAAGTTDLLLTYTHPVLRGGLLRGGTALQAEWLPTHGNAFHLAFTVPLGQPNRGYTRPRQDHVILRDDHAANVHARDRQPALSAQLADMRERARWVARLSIPSLRGPGDGAASSVRAGLSPVLARLGERGSVDAEIRSYHAALARAFSLAVREPLQDGVAGRLGSMLADTARLILLERVLLPYDRLLGQFKRKDTVREFGAHGRGAFARWLVQAAPLPPELADAALDVFDELVEAVESARAEQRSRWGDARLVWLPLQLALLPQDYDTQEELDTLIGRAVGRSIMHGNYIEYVHNDRFHMELVQSIAAAREYHVLLVHDFRGLNAQGQADRLSLVMAKSYLDALRAAVLRYDSIGRIPAFFLLLDQHYFEANRSRDLLRTLQDPLTVDPRQAAGTTEEERQFRAALDTLRWSVTRSRLLLAERAQYGEAWLRALVKVHVSVTNPADPSFRGRQILPLVGIPDDFMRDHRKVFLYDVSEEDPYRGLAMYTGMGIGEHYAGRMWEDRALKLSGPAALGMRDQVRVLLETQGIRGGELPHVLRPRPYCPDYAARVDSVIAGEDLAGWVATRAVQLHNQTGFAMKEVSVADATLFGLLAPGGVLKIPDSLWLNELLASILAGSALRGARVVMVMPSLADAPSAAFMQLAAMHDLASRMVSAQSALAPVLARSGGLYRLGLYDSPLAVDALEARIVALQQRLVAEPFLRELFAFQPEVYTLLADADSLLPGAPTASTLAPPPGVAPPGESGLRPKLHLKGFVYVSREVWSRLISGRPMAQCMREYLVQRGQQRRAGAAVAQEAMTDALTQVCAPLINDILRTVPVEERNCPPGKLECGGGRWAMYMQVGSANQDYRSMVMDGEAVVLVSNWTSLHAIPDFLLLLGLTAWPEDQAELDRLLPAPSAFQLALARWIRMGL